AVRAMPWQGRRNAVVSVNASDFLDQVFGDRDIEPENGWQHVPIAILERPNVEVEALENRFRLLQRHMLAEDLINQRGSKPHAHRFLRTGIDIGPLTMDAPACQLCDQGGRATSAREGQLSRQPFLKTGGCLGP